MVKTATQLYTLHNFDVSQADKIRIAGETDVDGVEIVFDGIPSEETQAAFDETGLEALSVSVGLDDIEEDFETIVACCEALDAGTVVLGHLEESYVDSPESARETGAMLSEMGTQFDEEGLRFLYHTHRYEFNESNGQLHFEELRDATNEDVDFEIDLGWAAVAGVDPVRILETYGEDIRSVHLKDMRIDTEEFVSEVRATGSDAEVVVLDGDESFTLE
jgi:sugar phosphate isomerase/epimerase